MESRLAIRFRNIIGVRKPDAPTPAADVVVPAGDVRREGDDRRPTTDDRRPTTDDLDLSSLGGHWRDSDGGRCFVVERRRDARSVCGCHEVGMLAERLARGAPDAPMLVAGRPAGPPFLFFDLETTGLSGGAGTYAFLVGCGWFDDDGGFVTRQFLLTRVVDERALLGAACAELARAGAIVSFNGKSFDAPVLEMRHLFHRLDWVGGRLPHVDVLHPARRFWGTPARSLGGGSRQAIDRAHAGASQRTFEPARPPGSPARHPRWGGLPTCTLVSLERHVLGARRSGDVPGFEIPERYFRFVRSGDARPLVAVLEHNRLDLLSLAGLTTRLLDLVREGPRSARNPREALALGHLYARSGFDARARDAYTQAVASCGAPAGAFDVVKIEALRALALAWRRARRYDDSAACWRQLLDIRGCPAHIMREAAEGLAIHHEHRVRDFAAAKLFALRTLDQATEPNRTDAVRHRLARINRKIDASGALLNLLNVSNLD